MHNRVSIIGLGGSASPGVFPSSPTPGTGTWATVQIADGGDGRSSQNIQILANGTTANVDYLAYRTIDWPDGGSYLAWTANVDLANILHFFGDIHVDTPATFYLLSTSTSHQVAAGAVLNIGSPGLLGMGTLAVTANGSLAFDIGSNTTWVGGTVSVGALATWTFETIPTFAAGGLFNGAIVRTGTAAFDRFRINDGPDATQSITATDLDTWRIPVLSAAQTWTLDAPVAGVSTKTRFRIRQKFDPFAQAHSLTIKDPSGTTLAVFAPGAVSERPASVDFEQDDDAIWAVVGKYDPDGHVSVA